MHDIRKISNQHPASAIPDPYVIEPGAEESIPFYRQPPGLISYSDVASIKTPILGSTCRIIKRGVDVVVSVVAIVLVLSWLIPIIALIIKLDSKGPVFFLQKRSKRGGKLFTCIKFRSMIVNDKAHLVPAKQNDQRITRIGRFLRDHYLDELPQFFNVLWGDMSIVGPRPHMLSDNIRYEEVFDYYNYRYQVKPGITGLAQVMGYVGPGDIEMIKERLKLDIYYIRHWTPQLETKIFFLTALKMVGLNSGIRKS